MTDNTTAHVCLTCGETIKPHPITGSAEGNNPWPLSDLDPEFSDRRVCDECNGLYVIPARLGHGVSGRLFDQYGVLVGGFGPEVQA